jgi:hypothetical protein
VAIIVEIPTLLGLYLDKYWARFGTITNPNK